MKPILTKDRSIFFIDSADMIRFIEQNSDMTWNEVCDFIRNTDITQPDLYTTRWGREELQEDHVTNEQRKWIGAFFEAHPWMDQIAIVFDS